MNPYEKLTLPESATASPTLTCSAIHGWRKKQARLVHYREFDDLHVRARPLELDLVHAADNRGVLAHVREGDLAHSAEVQVAVGHVQQQVAHAGDAQALQGLRAGGGDKAKPRHRIREGTGSLHPL